MNKPYLRRLAILACAVTALVSAVLLARYAIDYFSTRQQNAVLAAQYHADVTQAPTDAAVPTAWEATAAVPTPDAAPSPVPAQDTVPPTALPRPTYDPFGGYPNNRYREVSPQFKQLQKTNPDICGWITIGTDLDQAVVQRDNSYYLTRDYTGRTNGNGAIFLDEQVKLYQRPVCYILYGHNMKTEAMFGMLHKYDRLSYLRDHAVITFNTEYEDGQFAVFAVGTVFLDPGSLRFADYYNLPHAAGEKRTAILSRLLLASDYSIPLEVAEEDQLLILVTCTGDSTERRFVAARRLRDGEDARSLSMTYLLAEKR